jgi:hyperosmotically inducible protein
MKIKSASLLLLLLGTSLTTMAGPASFTEARPVIFPTFVRDWDLTNKVQANLAKEMTGSEGHVSVKGDRKGAVLLTGIVKSRKEADKAVAIALATDGVTQVKSDIQVQDEMRRMTV